jgi:hypothetical protein
MSSFIAVLTASVLLPFAHLSAQEQLNGPTPSAQDVSASQAGSSSKKLELSLGWWLPKPVAKIGIGWYLSSFLELEPSVILQPDDAVFSVNISANFSEKGPERNPIIPYVTAGVGTCVHEMVILNAGGGMKIRLGETLGVRVDLVYYRFEEEGSVTEGVAWFLGLTSFFQVRGTTAASTTASVGQTGP